MEPFKMSLHELLVIGSIIVTVTTAYVFLSTDVQNVKSEVRLLSGSIDRIQEEQFKLNYLLGLQGGWTISSQELDKLRNELDKKPWRKR